MLMVPCNFDETWRLLILVLCSQRVCGGGCWITGLPPDLTKTATITINIHNYATDIVYIISYILHPNLYVSHFSSDRWGGLYFTSQLLKRVTRNLCLQALWIQILALGWFMVVKGGNTLQQKF